MLPKQEAWGPSLVGEPRLYMPLAQTKYFFKKIKKQIFLVACPSNFGFKTQKFCFLYYNLSGFYFFYVPLNMWQGGKLA